MNDSGKVKLTHTRRAAFVYIRQSSPQQVENNRESTARQYALVERACELGWAREQVIVVDEDLGFAAVLLQRRPALGSRSGQDDGPGAPRPQAGRPFCG